MNKLALLLLLSVLTFGTLSAQIQEPQNPFDLLQQQMEQLMQSLELELKGSDMQLDTSSFHQFRFFGPSREALPEYFDQDMSELMDQLRNGSMQLDTSYYHQFKFFGPGGADGPESLGQEMPDFMDQFFKQLEQMMEENQYEDLFKGFEFPPELLEELEREQENRSKKKKRKT